jgi:acyl-CoA reductase-like NAD-dependent aldehyde dehydrogenase
MSSALSSFDPRTGAELASYAEGTVDDVAAACERAAAAARDPRLRDHARRAAGLRAVAARLRAREEDLVELVGAETGLPEGRVRGELARTAGQIDAFATVIEAGEHLDVIIDHADPSATPPRPDLRHTQVARGPVAVFGASNFPLAFGTAGGDTASALAAGCPVVVKGHPAHPGTHELVAAEVAAGLAEAGLPDGTFGAVLTSDPGVAGALVDHPAIQAVAFTGSLGAGRAIMDRAAARPDPIPVFAEMGSLNPTIVTPGAAKARGAELAKALVASVCDFGGQLCTKPGLVLVPSGPDGEAFATALAEGVGGRDPEVLLHAGIAGTFDSAIGALDGVEAVTRLTEDGERSPGAWAKPVVHRAGLGALAQVEGLREEHFGPGVVALVYDDLADVPAALGELGGQLTWTIHGEDDEADALRPVVDAAVANAGRVLFRGVSTGVAVAWATVHGGPWPATSDAGTTSVGMTAARRFLRPVVLQDAPEALLPPEVREDNPLGLRRRVDGVVVG